MVFTSCFDSLGASSSAARAAAAAADGGAAVPSGSMKETVHRHHWRWIGVWTKCSDGGGDGGDGGVGGVGATPPVTWTSSAWPTPSG